MEILYNTVVGLIRPLSSSVKYKSISESATINRDNDDNPAINLKKKSTKKMKKNKKKKKGKNDLIQIFVTVPDGHCHVNINIESIIIVNDRPFGDIFEELEQRHPRMLDPNVTVWTH
ncbi:uncharacterized protein LOC124494232 [Dermatophagoides farinae]|uniref:Uncharacterized protein n=1 Tax=Dermatophagoides farinae TaxID=6954 RepID=A0A9D4SJB8_DERFA|nr:uncharacterized protein LOC124494232 [Dermatophagoides farinae]KAH7644062.1 hypothetical protein HUG17_6424 [Dermatophagoides farinae]